MIGRKGTVGHMADLCIKMGVQAPAQDVNDVLKVLDHISQNHSDGERSLVMKAYAKDLTDGAIGVLASMSIIVSFMNADHQEKTITEPVIAGFNRIIEDDQPAYVISIAPLVQKLVALVYKQREYENDQQLRAAFIQQEAERLGL